MGLSFELAFMHREILANISWELRQFHEHFSEMFGRAVSLSRADNLHHHEL